MYCDRINWMPALSISLLHLLYVLRNQILQPNLYNVITCDTFANMCHMSPQYVWTFNMVRHMSGMGEPLTKLVAKALWKMAAAPSPVLEQISNPNRHCTQRLIFRRWNHHVYHTRLAPHSGQKVWLIIQGWNQEALTNSAIFSRTAVIR